MFHSLSHSTEKKNLEIVPNQNIATDDPFTLYKDNIYL